MGDQQNILSKTRRLAKLALSYCRRNGPAATLKWSWDAIAWQCRRIDPEFNRRVIEHQQLDKKYGVDTAGTVQLDELVLSAEQRRSGYRYEPCFPWIVREYLSCIQEDFSDFTYVDLGSGKGRVLLIAAEYEFKQAVGVEFAKELHDAAAKNFASARIPKRKCSSLRAMHLDASLYEFPNTALVISLFNPFNEEILSSVVENLLQSLKLSPRLAYIIYVNPQHRNVIENSGAFKIHAETPKYAVYRSVTGYDQ